MAQLSPPDLMPVSKRLKSLVDMSADKAKAKYRDAKATVQSTVGNGDVGNDTAVNATVQSTAGKGDVGDNTAVQATVQSTASKGDVINGTEASATVEHKGVEELQLPDLQRYRLEMSV